MSTRLVYNGKTFTDSTILSGEMVRGKSPLTDTLTYDTLEVMVLEESGDLRNFVRGSSADLYHNEQYLGKYYIDSVDRNSKNAYTLHFISALGLLNGVEYRGGIYNRKPCGELIADIMGGTYSSQDSEYEYYTGSIPFYIQKTLKNVIVSGWIPYLNSSRDALQQILFAVGGSVLKASNGLLKFTFWQPTSATQISSDRLYLGGSIEYPSKYTKVIVTEHEFRQTGYDKQVELFDSQGITVDRKLIVFDNPCHSIASSTLTVHESSPNYAIVSGLGSLTGYEYTHNTTLIEKSTGASGQESIAQIQNAYLVSSLNSLNVAERVASYYGFANVVNYGMVVQGDVQVGDRISFTDPFGDNVAGYIVSEDINFSAKLKSQTKIATNWTPNHQGNQYNNFTILSSGTSWTVPTALRGTPARVVIFGGFEGGQGGNNGKDGERGDAGYSNALFGGYGGAGGEGGNGGTKVNINIIDITSLGSSYTYSLGTGGNGGSINGGLASLGTDTTFNGISSATGTLNTVGWANPISGTIYNDSSVAVKGTNGGAGGSGGSAGAAISSRYENGANGQNIGSHTGGKGGTGVYTNAVASSGGGGGGATIDQNGNDGENGSYYGLAKGGNGASVTSILAQATLGQCGKGGAGGGGGGGGSGFVDWESASSAKGGSGGTGQAGQKGSNGFILIMHN